MTDPKTDQGIPELLSELREMVVAYLKQETLEPFKGLLKFIGFGVAGAISLSVGLVTLLVGVLRLLQNETGSWFRGDMSPVPYAITLATGLVVAAVAARAIVSGRASRARG